MAKLPKVYRETADDKFLSFNYVDVAEGNGVIRFYGYETDVGFAGKSYKLGAQAVYSSDETAAIKTGTHDVDFDLPAFQVPQVIRGTGIVNICQYVATLAGASNYYQTITATVRKWDGTTETDIAVASSAKLGPVGAEQTAKSIVSIPITIPATSYAVGDQLRLNIKLENYGTAGSSNSTFGFDPNNRDARDASIVPSTDDPVTTTRLDFHCPFQLQL